MSVTVNYFARGASGIQINGSTTAPTAVQASALEEMVAQVVMLDADTQALITHNWGFDVSAPTYFDAPQILMPWNQGPAQPAGTWLPNFTFDITNTNVVKMNKLNFLGTGGTFMLILRRPWSASR
jgi:hypothetical protein